MVALGLLAVAAAAVSWAAQYRMVYSARRVGWVAALEAVIPDAGSLVFASLGIALALHGRRAIRARTLNVCCVAVSVGMNALSSRWNGPQATSCSAVTAESLTNAIGRRTCWRRGAHGVGPLRVRS
jgi:hypothetical protein